MTNFNFKFLGAWLVIVASITGLQAQNDSTLKGKDEMVPAGVWNDVNGEYINAHGGGILLFDSKYYWFGEHRPAKGFSTEVGVTCYSSTDLCNWRYEGVALSVSEEAGNEIEKGCIMERPKVIYNKRTKKFVMWFHLELKGKYNPQIQISAESETKRSIFREKDKTKRSKKESAQHSKSRNKSFVMTSVSAL